jgi:hypothetical protein
MLQFDARITLNKWDGNGSKDPDFDWDEELAREAKEFVEFALTHLPLIREKGEEVYVLTISNIKKVE